MHVPEINHLIKTLEDRTYSFDQSVWAYRGKRKTCTTACCLAGTTVLNKGYKMIFDTPLFNGFIATRCQKGREKHNIAELAASILGLEPDDALILFDASADGWRHEEEFNKAENQSQKIKVAVKELRDLVRLGSYPYRNAVGEALANREAPSEVEVTEEEAVLVNS